MLIKTPEELLPLLVDAAPARGAWFAGKGYDWTARCPGHAGQSKDNFCVGRDEAGYLKVSCWSHCGIADIERGLGSGVMLQIRYPNTGRVRGQGNGTGGGDLGFRDKGAWEWRRQSPAPAASPPVTPARRRVLVGLHAEPAAGRTVTVGDLLALPRWFPAQGKTGFHGEPAGRATCWRHTVGHGLLPPGVDRVQAAAQGCRVPRHPDAADLYWRVMPQLSWSRVGDAMRWLCETLGTVATPGLRPALSLCGSEVFPFPVPLLVIDLDYKPGVDEDGAGLRLRDDVARDLEGMGAPIFPSASGNGRHALMLLADEDLDGWERPGRRSVKTALASVSYDIFPPGAMGAVALRMEAADYPADYPLPVVRWRTLLADDEAPAAEAPEPAAEEADEDLGAAPCLVCDAVVEWPWYGHYRDVHGWSASRFEAEVW